MRKEPTKVYFMCGKMAAGKSTYARELAQAKNVVLLIQDKFLDTLYPGEILSIQDFVKYSARVRDALSLHIQDLLTREFSVILDFPANTRVQRQWFREIFEGANVEHELHFIDAPNDLCKRQLRQRSATLPAGSPWTTDVEFDAITAYFQAFKHLLKMKSSTSFAMSGPNPVLNRTGRHAARRWSASARPAG